MQRQAVSRRNTTENVVPFRCAAAGKSEVTAVVWQRQEEEEEGEGGGGGEEERGGGRGEGGGGEGEKRARASKRVSERASEHAGGEVHQKPDFN